MNDNNKNVEYQESLDSRIEKPTRCVLRRLPSRISTTVISAHSVGDPIGELESAVVLGFVTNAGFLDSASSTRDGMRRCLADEFSFTLRFSPKRGNQRTSKARQSRREGGKIFGSGSRAPNRNFGSFVKNPCGGHGPRQYLLLRCRRLPTGVNLNFQRMQEFGSLNGLIDLRTRGAPSFQTPMRTG